MPFLEREEMQSRLDELTSTELTEARRFEIISELGQQHVSGLTELEGLNTTLAETNDKLGNARDAMAVMYSDLNAKTFGGATGEEEQEDVQETITIDDLLNGK